MDSIVRPLQESYQAGDLFIDVGRQRVTRGETEIPLPRLSFDLLVALAKAYPRMQTIDELMETVWSPAVVNPETVSQRVKLLRQSLGDDPNHPRYVVGIRGRGYRMAASVKIASESDLGDGILVTTVSTQNTAVQEKSLQPAGVRARFRRLLLGVAAALSGIGGALIVLAGLAAAWAIVHYRGGSKPAERASVVVSPVIHSLAVLPLDNLSGDKEQEYFADGMTDALTTDLAQIGSLRVISRTSAMQFKGSKKTLPQIGRELNVDAVVEGAVTRAENRVRVTAQLVETSNDHHLWARSYERDLKDVLALQDEIAQDISEQIRVKLSPKERSLLIQTHTVDPEAYDAYLRGSHWMNQLTLEGHEKACGYFQKAIAKDPSYALAYVGVARCQDTPDKYRDFVIKALALDPSLTDAHTRLAISKFISDWDWPGAEAEHKQAIALNPSDAPAHHWYSFYLVAMGRLDEALREIERASDLDPYDAFTTVRLGQVLYHARRYDDALRVNQRGLEMHPNTDAFYWNMADIYEQKKMFAEAFVARQQALSLQKDSRVTALGEAYKRWGYKGYLLKQAEFEQTDNAPYAAHCYALLNYEPRAITALEAAYNKRDAGILFMRTAPELDSIRSSARFRDLVRRIGFPQPSGEKN